VAQHAHAMRNVFRRLAQHVFRRDGVGADDFVRSDADANVFMVAITAKRCDHDVLGMQAGATALRDSDVDQWNNRAAQIEDAEHVPWAEWKLRDDRPFENFFDVEDGQAEAFATAAEDAKLRFCGALFERTDSLQHFCGVGVGRKRFELEVFGHVV